MVLRKKAAGAQRKTSVFNGKRKINTERRAEIGKEKRAKTRSMLLQSAFNVLGVENGMFTTIEEICAEAGISRGTFYNYFSSVAELYSALSYELSHEFVKAVLTITDQYPDAGERSAIAIRIYLERAMKDSRWGWGMVNISAGGPIFGAETHAQVKRTVEEGLESGEFKLPSAEIGRDIISGTTLSAMITLLRTIQHSSYPSLVAKQILIALGVGEKAANEIVKRDLPRLGGRS